MMRAMLAPLRRKASAGLATATLALLSLTACESVLGVRPVEEQPFPHRAHVLNEVACNDCHAKVARAGEGAPLDLPTPQQCLTCHNPPHDTAPCMTCHGQPQRRASLVAARDHLHFAHADHAGVDDGACMRCHNGVAEGDTRLRPTMATCLSCHNHQSQWEARRCDGCHRDMEAEGTRPLSHVVHGDDYVARHGATAAGTVDLCASCHAESHCTRCHGASVAILPNRLQFDRVTNGQLHRGGFLARHALEARAEPALCITCHSESRCQACHSAMGVVAGENPRLAPHPAGWVGPPGAANDHGPAARRDPMGCASCHGGAREALCVDCHRVGGVGGNPHPPGFKSGKRMSELPCRRCHDGVTGVGGLGGMGVMP